MTGRADFRVHDTERLHLVAVDRSRLEAVYAIQSDPHSWDHDPAARHRDLAQTGAWVDRAALRWLQDGLSYWVIQARPLPTTQAATTDPLRPDQGALLGLGGCQRQVTGAWNVFYRLAPHARGQGFAVEMARAAIEAARTLDDDAPVVAWVHQHNAASRRAATRLGLVDRGLHVDPSDGQEKIVFSDHPWPFGRAARDPDVARM